MLELMWYKRYMANHTANIGTVLLNELEELPDHFERAEDRVIRGLYLKSTCVENPEQYTAYKHGVAQATINLENGWLVVTPSTGTQLWWELDNIDDPTLGYGEFTDAAQRSKYLNKIAGIIIEEIMP